MSRYHAPPVSYPVGRCLFEGWVLLCLACLLIAALAAAAWSGADPTEHSQAARSMALGALGWVALVAWAGWRWWGSPVGELLWREGQWHWRPKGQDHTHLLAGVDLAWDGQGVLFVLLEGASLSVRSVWLERWRDASRWDDLRRAVWAARRTSASRA